MALQHLTVALDMRGCPNRCRHCWIGHSPNGSLTAEDLRWVAEQFRPHTRRLTVYDWYREPDYADDYRDMWTLCNALSDGEREHFELVSVWRLLRDEGYAPWLASLGVACAQLTLFGGESLTDRYTGRRGAFGEILRAVDVLLAAGIAPRLQVFINRENAREMPLIDRLVDEMALERRCEAIGRSFACFVHQGSCDGENEKLYGIRVTPEELGWIPPRLAEGTLRHFGADSLEAVFGLTEQTLVAQLADAPPAGSIVTDSPVFYVDKDMDVYPNQQPGEPSWRLGNLRRDGAQAVLDCYLHSRSPAQRTRLDVPVSVMAKACGDPRSMRLFDPDDYAAYLLNRFCRDVEKGR